MGWDGMGRMGYTFMGRHGIEAGALRDALLEGVSSGGFIYGFGIVVCRFFCRGHWLVLRLALDWGIPWLLHFGLLSIYAFAWSSAESSLHPGPTSVIFSVY